MDMFFKAKTGVLPIFLSASLLLSACTSLSSESRKQIISTDTVKVSMREPEIKVDAPVLSRPTAGDYAKKNMVDALGVAAENEVGALLLPITLPLGAAIGAASAPNDEKWSRMSAEYEKRQHRAVQWSQSAAALGLDRKFERAFIHELSQGNGAWNPCIQSRLLFQHCRNSGKSASISLRLRQRFRVDAGRLDRVSSGGPHEILAEVMFRPATGGKNLTACGYFVRNVSNEANLASDTSEWIDYIAKRFIGSIRNTPVSSPGGAPGPNGAIGPGRITRPASSPSDSDKTSRAHIPPRINGYGNFYWVDRPSCEWPK